MRLSEAIRLGAMMTSAARWTFFENGGACALGGALRAVGVTPDESMTGEFNDRSLVERWRWAATDVRCPACENHGFVWFTIMHLNDDHEWPRVLLANGSLQSSRRIVTTPIEESHPRSRFTRHSSLRTAEQRVLDRRGRPSYDRALHTLGSYLDSWAWIRGVAVGMHRQGYDLQLTQYDERGWRATFYVTGCSTPHGCDGVRWERASWHARGLRQIEVSPLRGVQSAPG